MDAVITIQIDTKPERLGRRVALHRGLTGDITSTIKALLPLIQVKNVESEVKLAKTGRFKEAWLSLKTSLKYVRDLW